METFINSSKFDVPLDLSIGGVLEDLFVSIVNNKKDKIVRLNYSDQHLFSLHDLFDEFLSQYVDQNESIEEFCRLLERYVSICHRVLNRKIESPIEEMFWKAATKINNNTVDGCPRCMIPGLTYQVPVKNYRVDFAIPHIKMVIEIDGHEYHKTKEQRTSDAKRERDLEELGWYVIRFTGSEIYKNVDKCIEQVRRLAFKHSGDEFFKSIDE